eukprot:INCI16172.1.p1 GENE.INCI16172.1~~INCI16172.1.p1  ORF type:complete len:2631 (-),score=345.72 INCI16172.1:1899-9791(-)
MRVTPASSRVGDLGTGTGSTSSEGASGGGVVGKNYFGPAAARRSGVSHIQMNPTLRQNGGGRAAQLSDFDTDDESSVFRPHSANSKQSSKRNRRQGLMRGVARRVLNSHASADASQERPQTEHRRMGRRFSSKGPSSETARDMKPRPRSSKTSRTSRPRSSRVRHTNKMPKGKRSGENSWPAPSPATRLKKSVMRAKVLRKLLAVVGKQDLVGSNLPSSRHDSDGDADGSGSDSDPSSAADDSGTAKGSMVFERLPVHLKGNVFCIVDEATDLLITGSKDCTVSVWASKPNPRLKFVLGGRVTMPAEQGRHTKPVTCADFSKVQSTMELKITRDGTRNRSRTLKRSLTVGADVGPDSRSMRLISRTIAQYRSYQWLTQEMFEHNSCSVGVGSTMRTGATGLERSGTVLAPSFRSLSASARPTDPFTEMRNMSNITQNEPFSDSDSEDDHFGATSDAVCPGIDPTTMKYRSLPRRFCITGSQDKLLKVWNLDNGSFVCDLIELPSGIYSVALHRDNRVCVAGTFDASIFVISMHHRAVMQRLACHNDTIWDLAILEGTHDRLYAGSEDGTLSTWTWCPKVAKYVFGERLEGHNAGILCVTTTKLQVQEASKDNVAGTRYVLSSDRSGALKIWEAGLVSSMDDISGVDGDEMGNSHSRNFAIVCIHTVQCSADPVWSLAVSEDASSVITCSADRRLLMWDIQSAALQKTVADLSDADEHHTPVLEWNSLRDVALVPGQNKLVFVGDDDEDVDIILWDTSHSALRQEISGHAFGNVTCVAMQFEKATQDAVRTAQKRRALSVFTSADNLDEQREAAARVPPRLLVTGGDDSTVRVWDRDDGSYIFKAALHDQPIVAVDVTEPHPLVSSAQIMNQARPLTRVLSACSSMAYVWQIFCSDSPPLRPRDHQRLIRPSNRVGQRLGSGVVGLNRQNSSNFGQSTSQHLYLFATPVELAAPLDHCAVVARRCGWTLPSLTTTTSATTTQLGTRTPKAPNTFSAEEVDGDNRHPGPDTEYRPVCPIALTTARLLSSGDCGRVATGASDGTIILWQLSTLRQPHCRLDPTDDEKRDTDCYARLYRVEASVLHFLENPACSIRSTFDLFGGQLVQPTQNTHFSSQSPALRKGGGGRISAAVASAASQNAFTEGSSSAVLGGRRGKVRRRQSTTFSVIRRHTSLHSTLLGNPIDAEVLSTTENDTFASATKEGKPDSSDATVQPIAGVQVHAHAFSILGLCEMWIPSPNSQKVLKAKGGVQSTNHLRGWGHCVPEILPVDAAGAGAGRTARHDDKGTAESQAVSNSQDEEKHQDELSESDELHRSVPTSSISPPMSPSSSTMNVKLSQDGTDSDVTRRNNIEFSDLAAEAANLGVVVDGKEDISDRMSEAAKHFNRPKQAREMVAEAGSRRGSREGIVLHDRMLADETFHIVSSCAGGTILLWSSRGELLLNLSEAAMVPRSVPLDPFFALDEVLASVELYEDGHRQKELNRSMTLSNLAPEWSIHQLVGRRSTAAQNAHSTASASQKNNRRAAKVLKTLLRKLLVTRPIEGVAVPSSLANGSGVGLAPPAHEVGRGSSETKYSPRLDPLDEADDEGADDAGVFFPDLPAKDSEQSPGGEVHSAMNIATLCSAVGASASVLDPEDAGGLLAYDPLLFLQTRSEQELRIIMSSIGIGEDGSSSLRRALQSHNRAGMYFVPTAVSALAVCPDSGYLAAGGFDNSVSVVRIRSKFRDKDDGHAGTRTPFLNRADAPGFDKNGLPQAKFRHERGAVDNRAEYNLIVKTMWRHVCRPTPREVRVQRSLGVDYDYRVSTLAFQSSKALVVGTYRGRVLELGPDGKEVLTSDMALCHSSPILGIAADAGGVIVASDEKVRVYDTAPRQPSVEMAAYLCEEGYARKVVSTYPHIVNCRDTLHQQSLLHIFAALGNVAVLKTLLNMEVTSNSTTTEDGDGGSDGIGVTGAGGGPTGGISVDSQLQDSALFHFITSRLNVRVAFLRDSSQNTALDLAMHSRQRDCVEVLVDDVLRRQDSLHAADRECVACSLPQMAMVYPDLFRRLVCNLRMYKPHGEFVSRINCSVRNNSSTLPRSRRGGRNHHHHSHHHHHHHEHRRHHHHHVSHHHNGRTDAEEAEGESGSNKADNESQEDPEDRNRKNSSADSSTQARPPSVSQNKVAAKLLPIVDGCTHALVDSHFWETKPAYKEGVRMAQTNFTLSQVVPHEAVTPLPYLSHPLLFKCMFYDKSLQDCLHSPAMVPVLQYKWTHHAARLFRAELYLYLGFVILTTFVTLSFTLPGGVDRTGQSPLAINEDGSVALEWGALPFAQVCSLLVIQFVTFSYMHRQAVHLYMERAHALQSIWTWLAVLQIVLVEAVVVAFFTGSSWVAIAGSLLSLVTWSRLLFYMRAHKATGALVRMIVEILKDMKFFMLILVVILLGFTNSTFVLLHPPYGAATVSQSSILRSLVQMWTSVMGGFETTNYDAAPDSWLLWVLFVLFTFIVIVVMLNLLIALMGDSYERVNNQKAQARQSELAGIIVDIETTIRKKSSSQWCLYFPRWVHVLYNPNPPTEDLSWTSRTRVITNAVVKSSETLAERLERRVTDVGHHHSRQLRHTTRDLLHELHLALGASSSSSDFSDSESSFDSESSSD